MHIYIYIYITKLVHEDIHTHIYIYLNAYLLLQTLAQHHATPGQQSNAPHSLPQNGARTRSSEKRQLHRLSKSLRCTTISKRKEVVIYRCVYFPYLYIYLSPCNYLSHPHTRRARGNLVSDELHGDCSRESLSGG